MIAVLVRLFYIICVYVLCLFMFMLMCVLFMLVICLYRSSGPSYALSFDVCRAEDPACIFRGHDLVICSYIYIYVYRERER